MMLSESWTRDRRTLCARSCDSSARNASTRSRALAEASSRDLALVVLPLVQGLVKSFIWVMAGRAESSHIHLGDGRIQT